MTKTSSSWLAPLILFCLFPANLDACTTQCSPDSEMTGCSCMQCAHEHFFYKRGDENRCDRCTPKCTGDNKVEVTECTRTTNRVCHCKPGFYCPHAVKVDCRRECEPCKAGTFSSTTSLATNCQTYTDCAGLGMVVIIEGTSTSNRVCGQPKTTSDKSTIAAPIGQTLAKSTIAAPIGQTLAKSTIAAPIGQTFQDFENGTQQQTLPELHKQFLSSNTASTTKGTIEQAKAQTMSWKPTWVPLMLLFVLFLLVLMCLLVWSKRKDLKHKLERPSLIIGKYHLAPSSDSAQPKVKTSTPPCEEMDSAGGQRLGSESGPCSHQQVTMECGGKGESVNNTVGSIFIYSPGVVVLGSNSNEKKDVEDTLMTVPQKSSSLSQDDSVRVALQEEYNEELSFPIPATSK